jgi:hypothetical protein
VSSGTNTNNYYNIKESVAGNIYVPLDVAFGSYRSYPFSDFPQIINFEQPVRSLKISVVNTSTNNTVDLNGGNYEILLSRVAKETDGR